MDEPIIYGHVIESELPDEPPEDLYDKLEDAIISDNKDEFLRLIKEPDFYGSRVDLLLEYDSLKIATALINGEARGIIDDDVFVFKDGWTPLHLACFGPSPGLVKDLIDRRDLSVDARCDYAPLRLKQATPLDLALEVIDTGYKHGFGTIFLPWTPNCSIFDLLHYVCDLQKPLLEVIRLLVQKTENKEAVRNAFFKYAKEGKLIKLTALFLAVPELFLPSSFEGDSVSCIEQLYLNLISLVKKDIRHGFLLLLDVFYLVGHKLIAYIRVDHPKDCPIGKFKLGFFLHEAVREAERKKLGISSVDDYLSRLCNPVSQHVYPDRYIDPTDSFGSYNWNLSLKKIKITDMDINKVNRMILRVKPHNTDVLEKAINNKLSVMPRIRTVFEDMRKLDKIRKQRSITRRKEKRRVDEGATEAANANVFPVMVGESRVINPT